MLQTQTKDLDFVQAIAAPTFHPTAVPNLSIPTYRSAYNNTPTAMPTFRSPTKAPTTGSPTKASITGKSNKAPTTELPTYSPTFTPTYSNIPTVIPNSNDDFNNALKQYTKLDQITSGGVIGTTNTSLKDIAVCRASNYNAGRYKSSVLGFEEYVVSDVNDYANTTASNGGSDNDDETQQCHHIIQHIPQRYLQHWKTAIMITRHKTWSPIDNSTDNDIHRRS
jgi:hypothetical protein